MDKCKKSQVLKLFLIVALLSFTPFLSSSLRPTYLYFIFNLLIILLGEESGLLTPSSKPSSDDQASSFGGQNGSFAYHFEDKVVSSMMNEMMMDHKTADKPLEESAPEMAIVVATSKNNEAKKSPSMPSLFFMGDGGFKVETSIEIDKEQDEEEEEICEISAQELFTRAENFIGNFYKQLKMQSEESFKKLVMD